MKRACIATVDAARARIWTFQEDAPPGKQLREVRDLVNPGRRLRDHELFSDSRPSLQPSGMPGPNVSGGPGTDDHRDDNLAMRDQKFAKEIVEETEKILRADAYKHLILIASPKMLGHLRKANGLFKRTGLVIDEIPGDLSNLSAAQLHDHLASMDLLPGRQRLSFAR